MAKQVLGRNLGALLDTGVKEAGKNPVSAPEKTLGGSGVRTLMQGHPTRLPDVSSKPKTMLPGWYLLGGDIVLGALALVIVCKSPHPLSWQKEVFCAAAVILGGCLALGAVLLQEDGEDR
jgi:hypothetical protein